MLGRDGLDVDFRTFALEGNWGPRSVEELALEPNLQRELGVCPLQGWEGD